MNKSYSEVDESTDMKKTKIPNQMYFAGNLTEI